MYIFHLGNRHQVNCTSDLYEQEGHRIYEAEQRHGIRSCFNLAIAVENMLVRLKEEKV